MKLRMLAISMFCLTFASLALAGQPGGQQSAAYVAVGRVGESNNVEVKRYTGHIASSSSVNLVARVAGELIYLGFNEGDYVEKGQVLARLDPVRYEAEVKMAEAKVAEMQARLDYAEVAYNRSNDLYYKNAGTKDSLDAAESEHAAYTASLMSAEAQLITARDDLKHTEIVAPISGKIGVTHFTEGNYLTTNSGTIATIIQVDPLRVAFSMSNRDFLSMFGTEENLKNNAKIRLNLADDSLYEYEGEVEFIDNLANASTDTIQIYAKFHNPDGKLIPNSTVTVMLSRGNGGKVPAVTPSAIMHDSKAAYVYVVDDEYRVERREVVLGATNGQVQLVKSGIAPGEMIVVDGMHKTMPGGVIEPDFQG